MDKLRLTTVTPSKKKKEEINFKSKVKKLIKGKKITKNEEFFVHGKFKKTNKTPEIKILSDVTKLLLESVQKQEEPVSVESVEGAGVAQLETGNQSEMLLCSTPDLKGQQRGHSIFKDEKLKDGASSKAGKQNPGVAEIRHVPRKTTEVSTAVKSKIVDGGTTEEVAPEAGGRKFLKMEKTSTKLAHIEATANGGTTEEVVPEAGGRKILKMEKTSTKLAHIEATANGGTTEEVVPEAGGRKFLKMDKTSTKSAHSEVSSETKIDVMGFTKEEKRRKKRKRKDSNNDSVSGGEGKFSGRQDSSSCSADYGEGAIIDMDSNKEHRTPEGTMLGRKSDAETSHGVQVSVLSPYKSERHGKGTLGGLQDSGSCLSDSGKGAVKKKQRKAQGTIFGRKSDAESSQGSYLSPEKSEKHGKGTFGGRLDSGSCLSGKGATGGMDSNKKQRSPGTILERKSDTELSQGFHVSVLPPDKSEIQGMGMFDGRLDSGSCLSDSGKGVVKKKQRSSGTMLGRKSDTEISQSLLKSDLSLDKSERLVKEKFDGRPDSIVKNKGTKKEQRRAQGTTSGRKSDTEISQGFQVSDLSPEKSEKHGKSTFGGRLDSGSCLSGKGATSGMDSNKKQRSPGTVLGRKSDTELSQGFHVSALPPDKSEIQGMGMFDGRLDSGSCLSDSGKGVVKKKQRSSGTMLGRKSDTELSQSFLVSDLPSGKSERLGKEKFGGRQDSGSCLSNSGKGAVKNKGSKNEQRRALGNMLGRKSDIGISHGFQVTDLSPEKSERHGKGLFGGRWGSGSCLSDTGKGATNGMNSKKEQRRVRGTTLGGKSDTGISYGFQVSDLSPEVPVKQNICRKVKNALRSIEYPINLGGFDTDNNCRLERDEGLSGEEIEQVWVLDSNETDSEEDRHLDLQQNTLEHEANNSTLLRKETRRTLSMETYGTPNLISNRLQLIQKQEEQEQSYVYLDSFLQFKRSMSSECEVEESDNKLHLQFYRLPDNRYVLLLKRSSVVHFRGKLALTVLAGGVEILGCVLQRRDGGQGQPRVSVFSPRGSSLLALAVVDCGGRKDCKEAAVEAVASVGMQRREVSEIEYNYEEGDCLLVLEAAASSLYAYLSQLLPGQLLPIVEATEIKPSVYSLKELQCTFYLPNSKENVKTFVKNENWDQVVQRILDQNCVDGPASCTMLCGGKGVGKSTLLRYLVNKALSKHSRVLCLDFDPGQAEFTVPGCLSAVLVNQPLLGPNYTHLSVPEKSVYLGHVNVSQCPTLYLEAVNYIVSFCRDNPEFFGIPWFVNTMGFCKGLGVELTNTVIQMVSPTDLVQIQSQSKQRNFPKELQAHVVAKYRSPFRYITRSRATVDYQFHLIRSSAESKTQGQEAEWGFDARKLRDTVILSYLSQLVKPPIYCLTEIVPYMASLSNFKLRICHESVSPNNVLCVMNGCMVALCCTDSEAFLQPSEPDLPCVFQQTPVCECLGFGVIRGVDMDTKKLFLITPIPAERLRQVNCLVMGIVQLPACVVLNPVGTVGHVPYVTVGPGQPTGRSSRRSFTQFLLAGTA